MRRIVVFTFLLVCLSIISVSCITQTPSPTASQATPILSLPPDQSPATPTTALGPATSVTQGELLVHFIDVGQGDAILIDFGETEVLIDGGDRAPGIVAYLSNYIDGAIEVMVATHPHADHIGGLIAVLEHFAVEDIWYNGDESDSKTYQDFMDAVQSENAEIHIARLHSVIQAGALSLYVHHPANLGGTTNNNSIVLHLAFRDIDFLFTGDAEREAEGNMIMLSSVCLPEVEILKVGHHGSRTASSGAFLSITSPEVAIYMAGKDNTYGHPHWETIEALKQIGARIFGTDVNGTIVVSTNGETYTVQSIK